MEFATHDVEVKTDILPYNKFCFGKHGIEFFEYHADGG